MTIPERFQRFEKRWCPEEDKALIATKPQKSVLFQMAAVAVGVPDCSTMRNHAPKYAPTLRSLDLAEAIGSCDFPAMAKTAATSTRPKIDGLDPFFHLERGGDFNACVGRQGSEENYIDGYIDAAQELAAAVIDKRLYGKRDTLAMPILYNARHALELTLKFACGNLHKLGRLSQPVKANHDIEAQWSALNYGGVGDEMVRTIITQLEPFVASLAAIDEDGQELRYATNRDGKRSMDAVSLVDLQQVRSSLDVLGKLLSNLKYRIEDLYEEKASGTWTAECSRSDLLEIAKILPQRDQWDSVEFAEAKRTAMARFGLSSRKFSNAVKKLEQSRAARSLIGMETPLAHLTDNHVMLAIEMWAERYPPERIASQADLVIRPRALRREAMSVQRTLGWTGVDRVIAELSAEEIADLETVFYMGRERWLPEFYDATLERTKAEHALEKNLRIKVNHIMEKLNFAKEIENGAKRLGRPSLAARVADFVESKRGAAV